MRVEEGTMACVRARGEERGVHVYKVCVHTTPAGGNPTDKRGQKTDQAGVVAACVVWVEVAEALVEELGEEGREGRHQHCHGQEHLVVFVWGSVWRSVL